MAKDKYRINDLFGGGYTEYDKKTGKKEHFNKYDGVFSEGYIGNKGSKRLRGKITGQVTLKDQGDEAEVFHKGALSDDYYGSSGTHISKHLYGDGFSVTKKGKREDYFKNKGILTTKYDGTHGNSYEVFNDEIDAKKNSDSERKNTSREDREFELRATSYGARGPVIGVIIDLIIVVYVALSQYVPGIPKSDLLNHILLMVSFWQFCALAGSGTVYAYTFMICCGYMFVPHYFLHMIGLAYPRDHFFFTYSFFGVALQIVIVSFVIGLILYILGRNDILEKLFNKLINAIRQKTKSSKKKIPKSKRK